MQSIAVDAAASSRFRIVDRNGLVLASKDAARCGQRLRSGAFRQRLDLAFDGTPQFVRPYPDAELSVRSARATRAGRLHGFSRRSARQAGRRSPRSRWASTPTASSRRCSRRASRDDGRGVRVLRRRPDADAVALHDDDRRRREVLPEAQRAPRFLVHVRDPGGDPVDGHTPALEPAARPLTRAAALAVASRGKTVGRRAARRDRRAVSELPRRRGHRRVALAAGVRHGRRSPRSPPPRRSRRCATSGSASR